MNDEVDTELPHSRLQHGDSYSWVTCFAHHTPRRALLHQRRVAYGRANGGNTDTDDCTDSTVLSWRQQGPLVGKGGGRLGQALLHL